MTLRPGAARLAVSLGGCFALVALLAVVVVGHDAPREALVTAAGVLMVFGFVGGVLTTVIALLVLGYTSDREPDDDVAVTMASLAGSLFVAVFGVLALRTTGWLVAVVTTAVLVVVTHLVLRRGLRATLR